MYFERGFSTEHLWDVRGPIPILPFKPQPLYHAFLLQLLSTSEAAA